MSKQKLTPAQELALLKKQPRLSQGKLSKVIGYSIISINKWRKEHDDFPGPDMKGDQMYDVRAVLKWLEDHPNVGRGGNRIEGDREALMCANLEKRNALLDIDIEEANHRLVPIDKVLSIIKQERTANVMAFRRRILSEMPSELDGLSAREIGAKLEAAFNEFLKDVQDTIPSIIKAVSV